MKTFKCAFKHCQHESCEVPQDSAVKVGNRYMHKDCARISQDIENIKSTYYEKISNTVVMKRLGSVVNNIIFSKNINSEYLLFALNHAIKAKIPVKSPYGLHYLIDNQRIKDIWNKKKSKEIADEIRNEAEQESTTKTVNSSFNYSSNNDIGFGGIFKGGN